MCNDGVLLETNFFDLPLRARGKVRDIYELDGDLLFVATDRISAFDCILGSGIPCKGRVLTQTSLLLVRLPERSDSFACSDGGSAKISSAAGDA